MRSSQGNQKEKSNWSHLSYPWPWLNCHQDWEVPRRCHLRRSLMESPRECYHQESKWQSSLSTTKPFQLSPGCKSPVLQDASQAHHRLWRVSMGSTHNIMHIAVGGGTTPCSQGPVVQSVVSLTSLLRVISLTVLADSIYKILIFFAEKMWVAFALQKLLTFFQQKISAYLHITRCKF